MSCSECARKEESRSGETREPSEHISSEVLREEKGRSEDGVVFPKKE